MNWTVVLLLVVETMRPDTWLAASSRSFVSSIFTIELDGIKIKCIFNYHYECDCIWPEFSCNNWRCVHKNATVHFNGMIKWLVLVVVVGCNFFRLLNRTHLSVCVHRFHFFPSHCSAWYVKSGFGIRCAIMKSNWLENILVLNFRFLFLQLKSTKTNYEKNMNVLSWMSWTEWLYDHWINEPAGKNVKF